MADKCAEVHSRGHLFSTKVLLKEMKISFKILIYFTKSLIIVFHAPSRLLELSTVAGSPDCDVANSCPFLIGRLTLKSICSTSPLTTCAFRSSRNQIF